MSDIDKLKEDMLQLRNDMSYVLFLLERIESKLESAEPSQPAESIGIAPNTPGLNGPWMDEI